MRVSMENPKTEVMCDECRSWIPEDGQVAVVTIKSINTMYLCFDCATILSQELKDEGFTYA